jgi:hypothetical protein
MANLIYNYPKSSCECYECDKDKFQFPEGVPTNMSVKGCNFSPYYNCYDEKAFKLQQEPNNTHGKVVLNKGVVGPEKFNKLFYQIDPNKCSGSRCNTVTYVNSDARLLNAANGSERLQLNRPPLDSSVKLNTLTTDKKLDCYGQNYKSYSDVNAGSVMYYMSNDISSALFSPVFASKVEVVGSVYKDPMGNMLPQYTRYPKPVNFIERDPCTSKGQVGLSWLNDSQYQREDIISKQMSIRNKQCYEPRWTNNNIKN